ncbi:MAG: PAS domain S-box protein, partial [Methylotenera sp.]
VDFIEQGMIEKILPSIATEGFWKGDLQKQTKSGVPIWTATHVMTLQHPEYGELWMIYQSDISEQKSANEKLMKSEMLFKTLIESSPIPLALNDDAGNINYLNTVFLNSIGYTQEEIPTLEDWWPLAYPDPNYRQWVIGQWQQHAEKAKNSGKPFKPLEAKVRCKDGSDKTFLCSTTDLTGSMTAQHLVVLYDITERKVAEEDLKKLCHSLEESRDRYQDLYEFAPVGYLSLSNHGLISDVNWKATSLFGLGRKELNQHRLAEFVAEEDKALWQRTFASLKDLIEGEELSFDIKFNHHSGSTFTASLNCLRMEDDDDLPILRLTLTDVTQLKLAENKLIRNETYLQSIIDNEPESIKVVDASGCIVQMNPAGLAMLEANSLQQACSKPLIDYIAPEYQVAFKEMLKHVIAGETMQLEHEIIGLNGGRRWMEAHAVPIVEDGKKLMLSVTRDITEKKHAALRIEKLLAEQAIILDNRLVAISTARDRKLTWTNKAFEKLLGYSKKELTGIPTRKFYVDEADYQSIGMAYANIEHKDVVRKQYPFVRKDGQRIWVDVRGSLLDKESGESLWVFIDVTETKLNEV